MDDGTSPLGLLNQLAVTDRMKRVVSSYLLATATAEVARRVYKGVRERLAYTIAVPSGDEVYDVLHDRILELIPAPRRRSILLKASRGNEILDVGESTAVKLSAFYDSTREQTIAVDGHNVRVTVEKENVPFSVMRDDWPAKDRIVFTALGASARDAVLAFVAAAAESLSKREAPRFYLATRWGEWMRRDDLEPRPLSTVVLRLGQKERIVDDLRKFLDQKGEYTRLGVPYHRGYLFHGPPGTGKTSLAKALATHLGLDIYYVPLSDMEKDANLLQLVARVRPGSILLLEDIDVMIAANARGADLPKDRVTLSGLLNALDGISTPSGLVTVLTTNRPEVLDDALVRPGRVDMIEEIGMLDDVQLALLVATYFDMPISNGVVAPDWLRLRGLHMSAAQIAETLKRHIGDPDAQLDALRLLLA